MLLIASVTLTLSRNIFLKCFFDFISDVYKLMKIICFNC